MSKFYAVVTFGRPRNLEPLRRCYRSQGEAHKALHSLYGGNYTSGRILRYASEEAALNAAISDDAPVVEEVCRS